MHLFDKRFRKLIIVVLMSLTTLSCARVTTQADRPPSEPSPQTQPMSTQVTEVQPGVLSLEAGKSMRAVITGVALTQAQFLQGQRNAQPTPSISGQVQCDEVSSCHLTISTNSTTPVGDYKLALLDKNQRVLAVLPVPLTVEAQVPTRSATLSSPLKPVEGKQRSALFDKDRQFVTNLSSKSFSKTKRAASIVIREIKPKTLKVESGSSIQLLMIGKGFEALEKAEAHLSARAKTTLPGRVFCKSALECQLEFSPTKRAQVGEYTIRLLGGKGQQLAVLPTTLKVVRPFSAPPPPPPRSPTPIFSCAANAETQTAAIITGPAPQSSIGAGTVLQWERTGHDICGGFGSNKRYAIAVCPSPTPGGCTPANGFYFASVKPDDLNWADTDPGVYTLTETHLEDITKNNVQAGDSVFFQIRYNYTNFSTQYGEWDVRAFTLNLGPPVGNNPPTEVPADAPQLALPQVYSPNGPFSASWNNVPDADYYRVQLHYRGGSPSGTDMGVPLGESEIREISASTTSVTTASFDVALPTHTSIVVWVVSACNVLGCSSNAVHGVVVDPPATSIVSFSTIVDIFRAPSCVNCHAVAPTGFQPRPASGYEAAGSDNFGLPPGHLSFDINAPNFDPVDSCVGCHTAALTPGGSHPVPWQAPVGMDLREKNDLQLCQMAQNPGTLAENIEDHLLGDPLILWAIEGGLLPQGAGNTDSANGGLGLQDWISRIQAWVDAGASCD